MQFCARSGLPTGYGMSTSYTTTSLGRRANPKAFRLRVYTIWKMHIFLELDDTIYCDDPQFCSFDVTRSFVFCLIRTPHPTAPKSYSRTRPLSAVV
ncbi:hypothetical protein BC936DRAFT_137940 [Jimgerdemannia flammicorona]|uniref:Uncharacterized protein n=1 Tax=Jimgerdemannia flammicorona TaxID=994334 RepID=A0A433CWC5_9FUNG|nr:hypothetical protein BC936DRAFT_137940 [Jimgerdemannia flammicorona]